jgi:hypothetical protein
MEQQAPFPAIKVAGRVLPLLDASTALGELLYPNSLTLDTNV